MSAGKLLLAAAPGILALAGVVFLGMRDGSAKAGAPAQGSTEVLSPKDLGIAKHRFSARPGANEVAIFRTRYHSALDPLEKMTFDQIYFTNGDLAVADVIIAPMSFYRDQPEQTEKTAETLFRDSWRLRAAGFNYEVKDFTFLRSGFGPNGFGGNSTGELVYTRNRTLKSEDLVFHFEMIVMSLEKAKKLHPKLESEVQSLTGPWAAAYVLDTEPGESGTAP
ncbi:hypothetical protein [Luteolibacter sp. Populi]|uniref:hypothetical protein n=1 Tax=Luteolibacter sp. Populi TaxID=3230487 RepID=UPI0034660396